MNKFLPAFCLFLAIHSINLFAQTGPNDWNRSSVSSIYSPFYHGVASGDPLPDAVIIWTRVTTEVDGPVSVSWVMATDTNLTNVVKQGQVITDASSDYTVKVDVTGLQANTWYYYRFSTDGRNSLIGRTRTAPVGPISRLRFAVVSCSNYQAGYFNAYREIALRNDVDAVLHLGDYIYEYEAGAYGYFGDTNRSHIPLHEILDLSDYRMRYSHYRLDPDMRYVHQQFPFICVWDDHESANDSWYGGAQNHNSGEGDWFDRKAASIQAYLEWMPIRQPDPLNDQRIYRKYTFGNLAELFMLDTRLEGREEQASSTNASIVQDSARTILGAGQYNWLVNGLSATQSTWKILGQQVMMAPLTVPILFPNGVNADQWDGYPKERARILSHLVNNNIPNGIVLTGDIHTSWACDLPIDRSQYNASNGAGSAAVEFVVTSVTSPGLAVLNSIGPGLITTNNTHIKYVDLASHGFYILDLTDSVAQADWVFLSTVEQPVYTTSVATSWFTRAGERHLRQASASAPALTSFVAQAPLLPDNPVSVQEIETPKLLSVYPNPFAEMVSVQYYIPKAGRVQFTIADLSGKTIYEKEHFHPRAGLYLRDLAVDGALPSGTYLLQVFAGDHKSVFKLVKP